MAEVKKCIGKVIELTGEELARAEYEYREKVRMDRAAEIEYGKQEGIAIGEERERVRSRKQIEQERTRIAELLKQGKSNVELLKILEENS